MSRWILFSGRSVIWATFKPEILGLFEKALLILADVLETFSLQLELIA